MQPQLATRFARHATTIRSATPLSDDQIRRVAPSIFAAEKHISRSERYAYIPTSQVLAGLRKEGFEPFMVCQSKSRLADRREFTKHMLRLRHASLIEAKEASEIVLVNSHDGSSAYQMLAGKLRFVCQNGLIAGDDIADIRVPHKGDVTGRVIEGAFTVLDSFARADEQMDGMKALRLDDGEQEAFARAALALRYDQEQPAPVTESQLLRARRAEDVGNDLWRTFNRVQENMLRGGLDARAASGRRSTTREVRSIDTGVKLNRALWVLAEEMRRLRRH